MPHFLVHRSVPGARNLTPADLQDICRRSGAAIASLDGKLAWEGSYICENAVVCICRAEDESFIHEHGRRANLPVTKVHRTERVLLPTPTGGEAAPIADCAFPHPQLA